jgi:hypothetical protein
MLPQQQNNQQQQRTALALGDEVKIFRRPDGESISSISSGELKAEREELELWAEEDVPDLPWPPLFQV